MSDSQYLDFQPDPRTPPNVGGPLGVLLKWLDAFLTVIDNVYLKLKSWVRRKGSKGKRSKRSSKQRQPMMEQAYTTSHSQPASTAYARKGRVSTSTERQRMTGATSPVSPVSGTFSSSDHSHGAPVEAMTYDRFAAQPAYVPSQNNAYAAAMAQPDKPHPHASPKAKPAPAPKKAETEALVLVDPQPKPKKAETEALVLVEPQPKPKTQVSRLVTEEVGPARSNSTRSKKSTASDNSAWKPSGPYRSPEQRHSGAFSAHSTSPSASSHALGHAREPSHGSLAAIAASNSRRSGEQARYDAVRPLSPQYAPSPAQRSISPQYGRADTPSYNDFGSRPTSPPQQWEPAVPTTTGVTGAKYAHVTTGRTGTKYAHVSADRIASPSSPSPTASSWHVHQPSEGHDSYNGGWNAVGRNVDVDAAYKRWSAHSGASSNRTRSTFGSPTHESYAQYAAQQPSQSYAQYQQNGQQYALPGVPGQTSTEPAEEEDFSDESLYDVPNPTASKETAAQSYAAVEAERERQRSAQIRAERAQRAPQAQSTRGPQGPRQQQAQQAQQKYVPGQAYAPPPEDTASDFSDESIYDAPNPTASKGTTAQSYAAAYAANLKKRAASLKSGKSKRESGLPPGAGTRSQTYVRRSEIVA